MKAVHEHLRIDVSIDHPICILASPHALQVMGKQGVPEARENPSIPPNVHLICGHPDVEVVAVGLLPMAFRKVYLPA